LLINARFFFNGGKIFAPKDVNLPQIAVMAEIKLKKIPPEIKRFIIQMQAEIKEKKNVCMYSMESTVYSIITEHPKFNKSKKTA